MAGAFARCAFIVRRLAFIVWRSAFGVGRSRVPRWAFGAAWLFSFSYAPVLFLLFFFSVSLCDFSVNLRVTPRKPGNFKSWQERSALGVLAFRVYRSSFIVWRWALGVRAFSVHRSSPLGFFLSAMPQF